MINSVSRSVLWSAWCVLQLALLQGQCYLIPVLQDSASVRLYRLPINCVHCGAIVTCLWDDALIRSVGLVQFICRSVASSVLHYFGQQFLDNSPNSTWLDSTRHIRRVEPMHFGCVELVEQHSSTRSTRRARLARHDELDWRDCNLVMITVIHLLFNLSYSLIYWSILLFNLFQSEQIGFVCVRKNKNTCKTFKSYRCCELFYMCCEI